MESTTLRLAGDVRRALHNILGSLELAMQDGVSDRQLVHLLQCRSNANRLLQIAADFVELSGAEIPDPQPSSFAIEGAVSEVAELMRILAERKNLKLQWTVAPSAQMWVTADRGLLQDVLLRVLHNAIRFTDHGAIDICASAVQDGGAARVTVEVSDTGPGLPPGVLEFLDGKAELPGEGLGLAIARKRLARVEGDLFVVSSPGVGTIVRISIPARLSSETPPEIQESQTPRLRILVAEDSDDAFLVFQGFTYGENHVISRAVNGAKAVEMAQSGDYDLILMDAQMPELDGYLATQAIREWESNTGRERRVPIVLFSADDPVKQRRIGATVGCSGYLNKPATKADVLRALRFFAPTPQDAVRG